MTQIAIVKTELPEDRDNLVLMDERALAARWGCSVKKLQADRLRGLGVVHLKIGRLVRYRLSDICEYETAQLRRST